MASGHRQSPVNISRDHTTRGSTLKQPLTTKYVPGNTKSLLNTGYCWRVDVNGNGSVLSGGPLMSDEFQLEQFHCHWGCSDGEFPMKFLRKQFTIFQCHQSGLYLY